MAATLRHFAITVEDLGRAQAFYEAVMGWEFAPWGPPDYRQLKGAGVGGGMHLPVTVGGRPLPGMELTFGVPDLDAVAAAVQANGGSLLGERHRLEGVGTMLRFLDPGGEIVVAMTYEREFPPTSAGDCAKLRHFAINADDVAAVRRFYEQVFGWTFTPWGPPGFYQTRSSAPGHLGALQQRRSIGGQAMPGIELTFGVPDLAAAITAIEANGGRILMPPFRIEGAGELIFFRDCEGNIAGAMQYDEGTWE